MPDYIVGTSYLKFEEVSPGWGEDVRHQSTTVIRTAGKPKRRGLLHDEKISKKRLPPVLWAQLEAVSRGTKVNHLGRGHVRGREDG